jgi:hypothetical protein
MQRIIARCSPFVRHCFDREGYGTDYHGSVPDLKNMRSWTERLGHSKLRSFTDKEGHFWLEQNPAKASKWAKLARQGHHVAWEFAGLGGAYTGRMMVNGEICTPSEATKKFLQGASSKKRKQEAQN